jgi:FkbM family methyltransferase
VLDLGANIGLTAAHYKVMWPKATIHAIEMDWESFELCVQNTLALDDDSVRCQWMAVGSKDGWATYSREDLTASAYHLDPAGEERVYCTTLNSWLGANGGIDFCKMDVEGAEWEILTEPLAITYLLIEFHGEPRDGPRIVERGIKALEEIGYEAEHHEVHPQAVFATKL